MNDEDNNRDVLRTASTLEKSGTSESPSSPQSILVHSQAADEVEAFSPFHASPGAFFHWDPLVPRDWHTFGVTRRHTLTQVVCGCVSADNLHPSLHFSVVTQSDGETVYLHNWKWCFHKIKISDGVTEESLPHRQLHDLLVYYDDHQVYEWNPIWGNLVDMTLSLAMIKMAARDYAKDYNVRTIIRVQRIKI